MPLSRVFAQSKSRPDVSLSRALFVAAFIGFWMLIVCARLVYLQFSQHDGLVNRARRANRFIVSRSRRTRRGPTRLHRPGTLAFAQLEVQRFDGRFSRGP